MLYVEIINYVLGFLMTTVNMAVLCLIQKIGIRKKATKTFLLQMFVISAVLGLGYVFRGALIRLEVQHMMMCRGLMSLFLAAVGAYLCQMLFMYVDVYLSITNLVTQSLLSTRHVIVMSVVANSFWTILSFMGMVFGNPDKEIKSFAMCTSDVYDGTFGKTYAAVFVGQFISIIVVLARSLRVATTGLRSVGTSVAQNQSIPPNTRINRLRKHWRTLRTLCMVLVVCSMCWVGSLAIRLFAMYSTKLNEDITGSLVQIVLQLPCLFNAVIYLVQNNSFKMFWNSKVIPRLCCEPHRVDVFVINPPHALVPSIPIQDQG